MSQSGARPTHKGNRDMQSDSNLLQLFCDSGDEAAFTMLVERHAGMVRAVIWRRTQDWSLVEEAVWKVFAVLARKAKSLRSVPLAGWLHRAAMHEAGNAARKAGRYRRTLRDYLHETMSQPPTGNATWEEIQPHLDAALARLPAAARELVLMHYLEQRGISEIASATGTNVEACRKRIRRSLDLLEDMLRRKGLVVSGTALAALFTAHSAGVSHAAAVSVAAAALKAAPSLTASSLVLHSLHLMNHTTLTKITVVALVLAAVPVTFLWQQNSSLQETVRELQAHPPFRAEAKPTQPEVALPLPPRPAMPATETGSGKTVAAASAESFHAAMTQKAQAKAKKQAAQEFTRICLNLPDLTEDQKARIQLLLETKFVDHIKGVLEVFQSGAVARAAQSTEGLTPAEKEAIAKLDPRGMKPPAVDGEMKAILTPEQFGEYAVRKEQKRIGDAEDGATDTLKSLGKKFDLTPEQKDVIFQQLAAHDLDPQVEDQVTAGNPFPRIGSRDETRDRIIRSQLTPPQAEIFDRDRAVEKEALQKQMMEYYTERASAGK